jgi:uncharacterized protein
VPTDDAPPRTPPEPWTTQERIVDTCRRIAVVGASSDPRRPSHGVVSVLLDAGFEVVPVNPNVAAVRGIPAVPSLTEVPGRIDLVDVFRRAEHAPAIAREAVAVGAQALWLQLGVRSEEARRIATDGGLRYVEDACLAVAVDSARHQHHGEG